MRRIAAPMIGGLLISFVMELVVYPVVFWLAKRSQMRFKPETGDAVH
jgi:Cu(I)/Ag(I) efflux system membrane protein CusA/SilA